MFPCSMKIEARSQREEAQERLSSPGFQDNKSVVQSIPGPNGHLYSPSIAAITNHHMCGSLNHKCIPHSSGEQQSDGRLPGLHPGVGRAAFLPASSRGRSVSLMVRAVGTIQFLSIRTEIPDFSLTVHGVSSAALLGSHPILCLQGNSQPRLYPVTSLGLFSTDTSFSDHTWEREHMITLGPSG